MPVYKFENFAMSTVQTALAVGDTTIRIRPSDASKFPTLGADERFFATIWDRENTPEIIECTARVGEVLTVIRGADGSAARSWLAGVPIRCAMTKGLFEGLRASALNSTISSIQDKQVLSWEAATSRWKNKTLDTSYVSGLDAALTSLSNSLISHTHTAGQIDGGEPSFETVRWNNAYQLANGFNLNSLNESGLFKVSAPTNGPAAGIWLIENLKYDDSNIIQYAYEASVASLNAWVRNKDSGSWQGWQQLPVAGHTHDDRYFTEEETADLFLEKSQGGEINGRTDVKTPAGTVGWNFVSWTAGRDNFSGFYQDSSNRLKLRMHTNSGTRVVDISPQDGTAEFGLDVTVDSISAEVYGGTSFDGATPSVAGSKGIVPAPTAGQQDHTLHGDGTWRVDSQRTFKTASTNRASVTALAADPVLLFPMEANKKYWFRFMIFFDTTSAADFKYGFDGPAAPTLVRAYARVIPTDASPASITSVVSAFNAYETTGLNVLGDSTFGSMILEGIVHNGANAGDLEFTWAQETSDPANTTVLAGSFVEFGEAA